VSCGLGKNLQKNVANVNKNKRQKIKMRTYTFTPYVKTTGNWWNQQLKSKRGHTGASVQKKGGKANCAEKGQKKN